MNDCCICNGSGADSERVKKTEGVIVKRYYHKACLQKLRDGENVPLREEPTEQPRKRGIIKTYDVTYGGKLFSFFSWMGVLNPFTQMCSHCLRDFDKSYTECPLCHWQTTKSDEEHFQEFGYY